MTTKDDVPSLQLEVLKRIQAELSRLNEKSDRTNERLDALGVGLESLKGGLDSVKTGLEATNERLDHLTDQTREGFLRLRTELIGLREEMDVGFTALRLQNDRRFLDHERRLGELERRR